MKDIIRIFDPTIDLSLDGVIAIQDIEYGSGNTKKLDKPYRYSKFMGSYYPIIDINGFIFHGDAIINTELSVVGFLPTVTITVRELGGIFGSQIGRASCRERV